MPKARIALSMLLTMVPIVAGSQGFGIYEHGACTMGRGGAGVAAPCRDGSAIYVNPAGILGVDDTTLGGGGTLISGAGSFNSDAGRRTSLVRPFAGAPHAYVTKRMSERWALGGGLYVPYGLGVQWPLDFEGRFASYDSSLASIYVQPTVAYRLTDRMSVGGGPVIVVSSVQLKRREDLASVPLGLVPGLTFGALVPSQTDFLDTALSAKRSVGAGWHAGLLVNVHDRVSLGGRYLSRVRIEYAGDATFQPISGNVRVTKVNPLGLPIGTPLDVFVSQAQAAIRDQKAQTALDMPAQLSLGVSWRPSSTVELLGDYQWVGWAAFDRVRLTFAQPPPPDEVLLQSYRNTSAGRVGLDITARPTLHLRGGLVINQAAAPDVTVTPLLPEARRTHVTAGLGWNLASSLSLDLAYQFIRHADRRGRTVNPPPGEAPSILLNSGVYRSRGDLLGITMSYRR